MQDRFLVADSYDRGDPITTLGRKSQIRALSGVFWILRSVALALAVFCFPSQLHAQFTDPRTYDNTPVGVNQLELIYAYAHSNASVDTSLIIAGAEVNLNQETTYYTRYFGFFRRLAWAQADIPLAGFDGSVTGTNIHVSSSGDGDSSYQLAMLLKGGPALSVAKFASYKPTTTVGMSLTITAPTGQYHPDRLLNLGSNRWAFKPEFAVSHPFGPKQKWEFDGYANAYFYTGNTSYHGMATLRQEVLPGLEGHLSYSFTSSIWASFDTRYSFGGDTFVNGKNQNNAQQNFVMGSEMNISLNSQNSLVFEFAEALVHQNGPASTGFAAKYLFSRGKG
jgi:Putative MetA-pathway of phenol degradation